MPHRQLLAAKTTVRKKNGQGGRSELVKMLRVVVAGQQGVARLVGHLDQELAILAQQPRPASELPLRLGDVLQHMEGNDQPIGQRIHLAGRRLENPIQGLLGQLEQNVGRLSALSTRAAANASTASFLQTSIRSAYRLSGGIDQDHRNLDLLEDDTNRTIVAIERVLNEIADDVSRQSATVASERRTMGSLALSINSGRMYGAPLSTRVAAVPAAVPTRPVPAAAQRRPLVTIRFDRPDVAYREPLYDAVSAALDRNPGVQFEVQGVAPARGEPADQARAANDARRQAEGVVRSLVEMGLPSDRVSLSAATAREASVTHVRVFVR